MPMNYMPKSEMPKSKMKLRKLRTKHDKHVWDGLWFRNDYVYQYINSTRYIRCYFQHKYCKKLF